MFLSIRLLFTLIILLITHDNACLGRRKDHTHVKKTPKITVVFIIDQFAHGYLQKIGHNLKYGLGELLTNGISYTEAYHAHGIPETTPGHHALSVGCMPKIHGAVLNQWIHDDYKKREYEADPSPESAQFGKCDSSLAGKSQHNTRVDGLSDQFMKLSPQGQRRVCYSLSLKDHPAISCAHRLGKALWFNICAGGFTSSKAYFKELPSWVTDFNKSMDYEHMKTVEWQPFYDLDSPYYDFPYAKDFEGSAYDYCLPERRTLTIDRSIKKAFDFYIKTPQSSQDLLDFADVCIQHELDEDENTEILLWISLSTLDLCGHFVGPDRLEMLDILYHTDYQIGNFMSKVRRLFGRSNCLFVVTGDHGICPIPEIAKKQGINLARRINAQSVMSELNDIAKKEFGLDDVVKAFEPTYFVFDKNLMNNLPRATKRSLIRRFKHHLLSIKGIKKVWTFSELSHLPFDADQLEQFYKNQLYQGRMGDLICMPEPYCLITNFPSGTSHLSPYEYDTHVPLSILLPGQYEHKKITGRVWVAQLPVTLAHILNIPKPSASPYKVLPGITD